MNIDEAVRAAQEAADCSTDPSVHRVKLALEAVQHAEHQALERSVLEPPDTTGIPSAAGRHHPHQAAEARRLSADTLIRPPGPVAMTGGTRSTW